MGSTHLHLGEDLGALVAELGQPVERAAREMIVLELYLRSLISSPWYLAPRFYPARLGVGNTVLPLHRRRMAGRGR
jgi:hypothetical protein